MKTADLYVRVSTDEQADKNYSQHDQEDRLRRYCDINTIKVNKVVFRGIELDSYPIGFQYFI